jgi:hypothetical protein
MPPRARGKKQSHGRDAAHRKGLRRFEIALLGHALVIPYSLALDAVLVLAVAVEGKVPHHLVDAVGGVAILGAMRLSGTKPPGWKRWVTASPRQRSRCWSTPPRRLCTANDDGRGRLARRRRPVQLAPARDRAGSDRGGGRAPARRGSAAATRDRSCAEYRQGS